MNQREVVREGGEGCQGERNGKQMHRRELKRE